MRRTPRRGSLRTDTDDVVRRDCERCTEVGSEERAAARASVTGPLHTCAGTACTTTNWAHQGRMWDTSRQALLALRRNPVKALGARVVVRFIHVKVVARLTVVRLSVIFVLGFRLFHGRRAWAIHNVEPHSLLVLMVQIGIGHDMHLDGDGTKHRRRYQRELHLMQIAGVRMSAGATGQTYGNGLLTTSSLSFCSVTRSCRGLAMRSAPA